MNFYHPALKSRLYSKGSNFAIYSNNKDFITHCLLEQSFPNLQRVFHSLEAPSNNIPRQEEVY